MPTLFTIGYEQATQAAVVATLREAGVEVLADIRYLPLSRRPGFSKSSLKAAVEEAGMEYRHFKPLGTPAEGRAASGRDQPAVQKLASSAGSAPAGQGSKVKMTRVPSMITKADVVKRKTFSQNRVRSFSA